MISKIAFKELTELLRDGRFRGMALVMTVLLMIAVVISNGYYRWVNKQHTAARENARNVWVSQDAKNPHSAAHYGTYAFKPKYALSLIDQGVDKYAGISIYLEGHRRNDAQYMAAQDQTAVSRFGDLTPDFILLFIVPLFIVLIGFNAFTAEREQGTLRLLSSQGISSLALAAGKWLGLFTSMLLVIIPVFVLALILLASVQGFGEFSVSALTLLFLFLLIYYGVFINITLAVSAWVKKSNLSLVILLAVWMIACLGMPKIANRIAETLSPYPTQKQFAAAIAEDERSGLDGHDPFSVAARRLEEETLRKHGVDSLQQLPFNWDGYLMQKGEEHSAEIYFRHYEQLKATNERQGNVYRSASVLSPYLPARFLSMALCRTDYASHWHFSDAAERYRIALMDKLNTHFAENSRYGDWDYKADKTFWGETPDFTYQPVSYGSILRTNLGNVGALLAWLAVSSVLVIWSVKKMTIL